LLFRYSFQNGNPDPVDKSARFENRRGSGCFKDRVSCDFRSDLGKETLSEFNLLINKNFNPNRTGHPQKKNQNKKMEAGWPAVKSCFFWFTR